MPSFAYVTPLASRICRRIARPLVPFVHHLFPPIVCCLATRFVFTFVFSHVWALMPRTLSALIAWIIWITWIYGHIYIVTIFIIVYHCIIYQPIYLMRQSIYMKLSSTGPVLISHFLLLFITVMLSDPTSLLPQHFAPPYFISDTASAWFICFSSIFVGFFSRQYIILISIHAYLYYFKIYYLYWAFSVSLWCFFSRYFKVTYHSALLPIYFW